MEFRRNKSGYKVFKENGKYKTVHKRVAEKKVGGKIFSGYEVHHIDGNKNNYQIIQKSSSKQIINYCLSYCR